MAVNLQWNQKISVKETLTTGVDTDNSDNMIVHDAMGTNKNLTASTTPPTTKVVTVAATLSGGALQIDLTNLTGANGAAVDLTGLKVQLFKIRNPVGNAAFTITEGSSNGYELAGNTWVVSLAAGQEWCFYGNDATPDVASGAKTIDCTGTLTQSAEIVIVAG